MRHKAIEEIRRFVTPGAQKSKGEKDLLPSLGFVLSDSRVRVRVTKLPLPVITAAGLRIPESAGGMWAPQSKLFALVISVLFSDCTHSAFLFVFLL